MQYSLKMPQGEFPLFADASAGSCVVILAHGAGSHAEHPTMLWLSKLLTEAGAQVVRFNFLYRALGKGMPDRIPLLIDTYRAVIEDVRLRFHPRRLLIGGHSMGGRVASMAESEQNTADGLILFGYPLHPPKQPEKLRDAHLGLITVPVLQVNGTRDEFCSKPLMDAVLERLDPSLWTMKWIEGADHSYSVQRSSGRTRTDVEAEISAALREWLQ
ncbi:MAG: hypothetical protein HONBIEJF_01284 [Fimbriimonadaceae bacterium]|nr:hypothetical protein [Fimbriimonadaceae bacterium]